MGEEIIKLINKLIDVSPYLAMIIAADVGFVFLFKSALKHQKELYESTIKTLTEDKEKFIKMVSDAYKKANEQ